MKLFIISILAGGFFISSDAQSLSYEDLINLQKSSLEKVKGFFAYKGWSWLNSEKDCDCLLVYQDNSHYFLSVDKMEWKNSSGERFQFKQKDGYSNAVRYYTETYYLHNQYHFDVMDKETNNHLKSRWQNIVFKEGGYSVQLYNHPECVRRISQLICGNCKGKGKITEYEKCSYCNGNGKGSCQSCNGIGGHICKNCEGKGFYEICSCGTRGAHIGYSTTCSGKKKVSCENCTQMGSFICNQCSGKGKSGICSYCNGKGIMSKEINKVCPVCNGSKLKQQK